MLIYIIRRMLQTIPVIFGVTFFVFLILHLVPGDPARVMAGEAAPAATVEALREHLGLNDPFHVQYFRWLGRIARGDLGTSNRTDRPVAAEIFENRFQITMQLAISATVLTTFLGLFIGIVQATRKYSPADTGMMVGSFLFLSHATSNPALPS